MSVSTNAQPPFPQFALLRGRRGFEPRGVMLGFALRRGLCAAGLYRRIKESVPC
jgi:hypothetical protein